MILNPSRFAGAAPGDTWTANNATLSAQDAYLKAYWKMEDTSDSIGSHTLTLAGGAAFTAGKHNNALKTDGVTTKYAYAPYSVDWRVGSGTFACSVWAKRDSTSDVNVVIAGPGIDNPGVDQSWFIFFNTSNVSFYASADGVTYGIVSGLSMGTSVLNTYAHYFMIRLPGDLWRTYKDGSNTGSLVSAGTVWDSSLPFHMGYQPFNGRVFGGQIDEVAYWKTHTLADSSAADAFASALYNGGPGAFLI
jgi:hypothetical protein